MSLAANVRNGSKADVAFRPVMNETISMKEWVFWAYAAASLAALKVVLIVPFIGLLVVGVGVALCVVSFRREPKAAGNPAIGLLGNVVFMSGVFGLIAMPTVVLNDWAYYLIMGVIFSGMGIILLWIFVNAWRKRAAWEARQSDANVGG
ncbi:hypothetical protein [Sphingomonas alba]|uniref:Integral membrane protein n=1 Tax=Sphingomonas alba TaxID=2908208 RepID=A0ABT0RN59_9SPHN|nr:hypothetical protein [Sphingomonas alba]MCL6683998.1 hypothetical protein [Sphingomonas alba]